MTSSELKIRTRQFAVRAIKLVDALPKTAGGRAIGNQFIRSAFSVGANYHSACRGRSKAEFIAKNGIVIEEIDECIFWLELILDAAMLPENRIAPILQEARELTAIFTATVKTAKRNLGN